MEKENIPLNNEKPKTDKVKTMDKDSSNKDKKVKKLSKGKLKAIEKKKKQLIKVVIDGKEYQYPKTMIFEKCPKEYKIQENNKKISQGEIAVLFMRESGLYELKYVRPENGMFIVQGRYYHIVGSCNGIVGKKRIPLAVIPEWSFIPLSKKEYEVKLGSKYQEAQSLIIKSLENAEIVKINQDVAPKHNPNSKLIVGIIIAAIVGLYVLNKFFGGA